MKRKEPIVVCGAVLKRVGMHAVCGLEAGHADGRHYDAAQRVTWNSRVAVGMELPKQNDSNLGDK